MSTAKKPQPPPTGAKPQAPPPPPPRRENVLDELRRQNAPLRALMRKWNRRSVLTPELAQAPRAL